MSTKNKKEEEIKKLLKKLTAFKTPLADERRANGVKPVLGQGSLKSKVMFVGEAPGKKEAQTGMPFCGASGKFLSEMLAFIGLSREDVYITNIVNDRPTDNRDPSEEEIAKYTPFLDKQIEIISPKVIVTLGRFSMQYIMQKFGLEAELGPISKLHGKVFEGQGLELKGVKSKAQKQGRKLDQKISQKPSKKISQKIKIIPLYHPAAALYNGSMRATLLADFKAIKTVI